MQRPAIEVLGVYRLGVTDELFREQLAIVGPDALSDAERATAERHIRQQLESVVLVELVVRDRDAQFEVSAFTQSRDGVPPGQWQAAWAETYLSADGESLATARWSAAPVGPSLRVAFFMHYWDPARPLLSSYGPVACPGPEAMPARLQTLVPYEPLD